MLHPHQGPFVEQPPVYDHLSPKYIVGAEIDQIIPSYICLSDPSHQAGKCSTTLSDANRWAISSYGGNYAVFGNPATGNSVAANRLSAMTDGLGTTVFFGEKYGTCGWKNDIDFCWGSLWANARHFWRPTICAGDAGKTGLPNNPPCPTPQPSPNWLTACEPGRPQSGHSGGIQVALGRWLGADCDRPDSPGDLG